MGPEGFCLTRTYVVQQSYGWLTDHAKHTFTRGDEGCAFRWRRRQCRWCLDGDFYGTEGDGVVGANGMGHR
jgi:hypothetical protein